MSTSPCDCATFQNQDLFHQPSPVPGDSCSQFDCDSENRSQNVNYSGGTNSSQHSHFGKITSTSNICKQCKNHLASGNKPVSKDITKSLSLVKGFDEMQTNTQQLIMINLEATNQKQLNHQQSPPTQQEKGVSSLEDFGDCGGSTGYQSREKKDRSLSSDKKQGLTSKGEESNNKSGSVMCVLDLIKEEMLRRRTEQPSKVQKLMVKKTHEMYVEEVQIQGRVQGSTGDQGVIERFESNHRLAFYQVYLESQKEAQIAELKEQKPIQEADIEMEFPEQAIVQAIIEPIEGEASRNGPRIIQGSINEKCPSIQILSQQRSESPHQRVLCTESVDELVRVDDEEIEEQPPSERPQEEEEVQPFSSHLSNITDSQKSLHAPLHIQQQDSANQYKSVQNLYHQSFKLKDFKAVALSHKPIVPQIKQQVTIQRKSLGSFRTTAFKSPAISTSMLNKTNHEPVPLLHQTLVGTEDMKQLQSLSARDKISVASGCTEIKDIVEKQRASVNRLSQAKKVVNAAAAVAPNEESRTSPRRMPDSINERGTSPKGYRSIPTQKVLIQNWNRQSLKSHQPFKKVVVDLNLKEEQPKQKIPITTESKLRHPVILNDHLKSSIQQSTHLKSGLPQQQDLEQLKKSINEVLLSESLKLILDQKNSHAEYFRHLKTYQRTICIINADVLNKFKLQSNVEQSTLDIGQALLRLFLAVKESISGKHGLQTCKESEDNELQMILVSWEDIITKMAESDKVYNTLLKTRYALENNLIGSGNLISINETLLKHLRQMKSLDITQDNEGAVYAIFRFLKSVIDLSDFIQSVTVIHKPPTPIHLNLFHHESNQQVVNSKESTASFNYHVSAQALNDNSESCSSFDNTHQKRTTQNNSSTSNTGERRSRRQRLGSNSPKSIISEKQGHLEGSGTVSYQVEPEEQKEVIVPISRISELPKQLQILEIREVQEVPVPQNGFSAKRRSIEQSVILNTCSSARVIHGESKSKDVQLQVIRKNLVSNDTLKSLVKQRIESKYKLASPRLQSSEPKQSPPRLFVPQRPLMETKEQPKQTAKSSILSYYNTSSRLAAASSKSSMVPNLPLTSDASNLKPAVTVPKQSMVTDPRLKKIEKSLGINKKIDKNATGTLKGNLKIQDQQQNQSNISSTILPSDMSLSTIKQSPRLSSASSSTFKNLSEGRRMFEATQKMFGSNHIGGGGQTSPRKHNFQQGSL